VFEACLDRLPAKTARVFMMREFLGFETDEICKEVRHQFVQLLGGAAPRAAWACAPVSRRTGLPARGPEMLSCRQATELMSQEQDRPLTLGERVGLRLHVLICAACTNYRRNR
jgi:hypothetical protein